MTIRQTDSNGRLFTRYKGGQAKPSADLIDYAFLIDTLIGMLQTRRDTTDLLFAMKPTDRLSQCFEKSNAGSFYFTADDHETR